MLRREIVSSLAQRLSKAPGGRCAHLSPLVRKAGLPGASGWAARTENPLTETATAQTGERAWLRRSCRGLHNWGPRRNRNSAWLLAFLVRPNRRARHASAHRAVGLRRLE